MMPTQKRQGYVLLVVLIVVAVLSLVAYQFTEAMTAEYVAAARTTEVAQARLNAVSGIHYAAASLTDLEGGVEPYDNPDFVDVPVAPSENLRRDGRFALVAIEGDAFLGEYAVRYGVTDEGGKLNINALIQLDSDGDVLYTALMGLPGMTEDVADAIVDWVDPDDVERMAGAETGYYMSMPQPYQAKNGPMNTLDELLLVRGVTPELLYGTDRNRNGVADDGVGGASDLTRGWSDFLTVYGRELNADRYGMPRVYLGESDDLAGFHERLLEALGQEMADYILAYKMFSASKVPTTPSAATSSSTAGTSGTATEDASAALSAAVQASLAGSPKNRRRVRSVLSMIGTQVELPTAESSSGSSASSGRGRGGSGGGDTPSQPKVYVPCPWNDPSRLAADLPLLLDATTGRRDFEMVPRINVLTAPREVLMALVSLSENTRSRRSRTPPLSEQDVDAIISARTGLSAADPDVQTGAWVVTDAGVNPDTFARLERYVTSRSMVYSVQSIGYFGQAGPVARVEAVVDTHQGTPRIMFFRDLTDLDVPRGFSPPR